MAEIIRNTVKGTHVGKGLTLESAEDIRHSRLPRRAISIQNEREKVVVLFDIPFGIGAVWATCISIVIRHCRQTVAADLALLRSDVLGRADPTPSEYWKDHHPNGFLGSVIYHRVLLQ